MNWESIGTWALVLVTMALVFVTWRALVKQLAIARDQMRVENQLKNRELFDGKRMSAQRVALATQLLRRSRHEAVREDVMNFFEDMGMLLRRGYLDSEMMWETFSYYSVRWWEACEDYVREERRQKGNDQTLFEDFEYLANKMYQMGEKRLGLSKTEQKLSQEEIEEFLREETRLITND